MLKPTVGMELFRGWSAWFLLVAMIDSAVTESLSRCAFFIDGNLLDCEFAALQRFVLAQLHRPRSDGILQPEPAAERSSLHSEAQSW